MSDDSPCAETDVCVIGGGWAGIAASVEATTRGRAVTLIEAAPQLGGRARTIEVDMGFGKIRLDNGQHLMMGAYRETLALIGRVSPDPSRLLERAPLILRDPGGLSLRVARLPAPLHLGIAFIRARGLGLDGRIACLGLMFHLKRRNWRVPHGETVSRLLERTSQPGWLIDRLWRPLCVSALNTPIDSACARTFAAVLRDTLGAKRSASDFILPVGTLGDCLPDPAARWLMQRGAQILLRTPVRALQRIGTGWRVSLPGRQLNARAVVLALPPTNSARLIEGTVHLDEPQRSQALNAALAGFRSIPIATTYLAWPRAQIGPIPRWTMLGPSETNNPAPRADWLFDRGVQLDHRIASVVVSDAAPAPDGPLATLTEMVSNSVTRALGLPAPAHTFTVFERRATFACVPDRPRIDQPTDGNLPSLWLAGDYTEHDYPATIESAVRSGLRAGALAAGLNA